MVQGELRLASSLRLGLKIVVFCDNSLNRIELKQMARQYPSSGTVIDETDMIKLADRWTVTLNLPTTPRSGTHPVGANGPTSHC